MQNRSGCTVAGKSKLAASVSHTSSAYALVSFILLACFRVERNERAEPCCWTLVEPRSPSSRVEKYQSTKSFARGHCVFLIICGRGENDRYSRSMEICIPSL